MLCLRFLVGWCYLCFLVWESSFLLGSPPFMSGSTPFTIGCPPKKKEKRAVLCHRRELTLWMIAPRLMHRSLQSSGDQGPIDLDHGQGDTEQGGTAATVYRWHPSRRPCRGTAWPPSHCSCCRLTPLDGERSIRGPTRGRVATNPRLLTQSRNPLSSQE